MFSLLNLLRAIPVVGSLVFIVVWVGLIVGFFLNLFKAGSGVLDLLGPGPTTEMLIHTGVRVVSLFIPIVNCIAGYF